MLTIQWNGVNEWVGSCVVIDEAGFIFCKPVFVEAWRRTSLRRAADLDGSGYVGRLVRRLGLASPRRQCERATSLQYSTDAVSQSARHACRHPTLLPSSRAHASKSPTPARRSFHRPSSFFHSFLYCQQMSKRIRCYIRLEAYYIRYD